MTDNTLNLDALTEAFKADCKVIRLKYEYPGYTGTEKYAIISDLSYEQIVEKHAPVVKQYILSCCSARLRARSLQSLSATRTSSSSGCSGMTAMDLRTVLRSCITPESVFPTLQGNCLRKRKTAA